MPNRPGGLVTLIALALSAAVVPHAEAAGALECNITIPGITVDPGLSTEPNSGVFHTHTEKGTIDCGDGGQGTIGLDGRYGTADPDSCQGGGEGWGVFSITLNGEQFKDTASFKFGTNTDGTDTGQIDGERLSGTYTFTGDEGNCVTSPITVGTVKMVAAKVKG